MRTILILLVMSTATKVSAECGNLCDVSWWQTATKEILETELK
jgi:hypothetical protein